MALTNAEKQARWRERNIISLTDRAPEIALKLIEMDDQDKPRKIVQYIYDHLRHPDRTPIERAVALGIYRRGRLNGSHSNPIAVFADLATLLIRVAS
jgi:hypothetical protein